LFNATVIQNPPKSVPFHWSMVVRLSRLVWSLMDFDGRERDSIDSVKVVLIESYFLVPLLYVFTQDA